MSKKLIALLCAALLALTLACANANVGDGSCEAPSPCGSAQGHNP